jgi:XisI protein
MDKIKNYSNIVQKVLENFVAERQNGRSEVQTLLICDAIRDHYQIVRMGWRNGQQVFNVIFHIDIINNKIWVQRNMSDYDIVGDIEAQGVGKDEIVLAFHTPIMRPHTGYATA